MGCTASIFSSLSLSLLPIHKKDICTSIRKFVSFLRRRWVSWEQIQMKLLLFMSYSYLSLASDTGRPLISKECLQVRCSTLRNLPPCLLAKVHAYRQI